jgi:hypothetical protein
MFPEGKGEGMFKHFDELMKEANEQEVKESKPKKKEDAYDRAWNDLRNAYKGITPVPEPIHHLMPKSVDDLLDLYNHYMALHETFGDEDYEQYAKQVIKVLKIKTSAEAAAVEGL